MSTAGQFVPFAADAPAPLQPSVEEVIRRQKARNKAALKQVDQMIGRIKTGQPRPKVIKQADVDAAVAKALAEAQRRIRFEGKVTPGYARTLDFAAVIVERLATELAS